MKSHHQTAHARGGQRQSPRRRPGVRAVMRMGVSATGLAALAGAAIGSARAISDRWSAPPGDLTPDRLLVLGAAGAALLLAGWLILGTVAAVAAHLPGRIGLLGQWIAEHWAPALSRRVAAALVGAATVGSLTPAAGIAASTPPATTPTGATATATPGGPGFASTEPRIATSSAAEGQADPPGWVPTRALVAHAPSPHLLTSTPNAGPSSTDVVVHRGDTLWDIARLELGPRASDAEVAQAWPRWYAANRTVIGPDPSRLLPGQILVAPAPLAPLAPGTDSQASR